MMDGHKRFPITDQNKIRGKNKVEFAVELCIYKTKGQITKKRYIYVNIQT